MRLELLIITRNITGFVADKKRFFDLLRAHDNIKVRGDKIIYEKPNNPALHVSFELKVGDITEKKERFYHLTISRKRGDRMEEVNELSREIKKICRRISTESSDIKISEIWNDQGFRNAQEAFPLIQELENLMRKLIARFFATKIGFSWFEEAVKVNIQENLTKKIDPKSFLNELYHLDFKDLGSLILFKPYSNIKPEDIYKSIDKASAVNELELDTLKTLVPKSNWDRYFNELVDYEGGALAKDWDRLYNFRCEIAHCRPITLQQLSTIRELYSKVKSKLEQAIEKIDIVPNIIIDVPTLQEFTGSLALRQGWAELLNNTNTLRSVLDTSGFQEYLGRMSEVDQMINRANIHPQWFENIIYPGESKEVEEE